MKTLKSSVVAMIAWMALSAFGAAVETVSESFVGSATTIPGVQGASERVSFFSLRAVRPALYAGKVSSVSPSSISDNGANWTAGLLAGRGALYAEFPDGLEADIQQVNVASKTITFSGTLPVSLVTGTPYRLREHHTVAELFGASNQAGLLSGVNETVADTILHYDPQTQQSRTYYYLNFSGITGWVQLDYSPASNIVIYPEQGLMVCRRMVSDITLTSSGPLKPWPATIRVFPGYNLLGVFNRATPVALDNLNLLPAGFITGANSDVADNLLKLNPDGTSTKYFYLNLTGFQGWYDFAYQPAGQITVSPGTVFMVYRRTGTAAFDWTLPPQ